MRPLKKKILSNILLKPNIWLCYVDHIFIIWEFGQQALLDFLKKMNNTDNNIKFTPELEKNATLAFFDV